MRHHLFIHMWYFIRINRTAKTMRSAFQPARAISTARTMDRKTIEIIGLESRECVALEGSCRKIGKVEDILTRQKNWQTLISQQPMDPGASCSHNMISSQHVS